VFGPACGCWASPRLILAHNHPARHPEPSNEDIRLTRQLVEAGRLMDLKIHDHVIIGNATTASCRWPPKGSSEPMKKITSCPPYADARPRSPYIKGERPGTLVCLLCRVTILNRHAGLHEKQNPPTPREVNPPRANAATTPTQEGQS